MDLFQSYENTWKIAKPHIIFDIFWTKYTILKNIYFKTFL